MVSNKILIQFHDRKKLREKNVLLVWSYVDRL